MASMIARHSPFDRLSDALPATPTLAIEQVAFAEQINLRGNPENSSFLAAAATILGCDLPVVPNTFTQTAALDVLWLGPDEWLVVRPMSREAPANLEASLRRASVGQHVSIADVSDCRALLQLSGRNSREILMKGCSLDVHPSAFGPGRCAQTVLAHSSIILQQLSDAPRFRIFLPSSFAHDTAKWLCDAAREIGASPA